MSERNVAEKNPVIGLKNQNGNQQSLNLFAHLQQTYSVTLTKAFNFCALQFFYKTEIMKISLLRGCGP